MHVAYHLGDPLVTEAELDALARELARAHPVPRASCAKGWPSHHHPALRAALDATIDVVPPTKEDAS